MMQSADPTPSFLLPSRPAAILFDGDGVVFDSEELSVLAFMRTWEQFGLKLTRLECGRFIGAGMELVFAVMRDEYGMSTDPGEFVRVRDLLYKEVCAEVDGPRAMAGIPELLDWLGAEGIPYAIASSASAEKLHFNLERSGLTARFPITVHGEEVRMGKPAPDIFLEAARRLGCDARGCIVLEDSVNGLRGALAAGATPVAIEGSHPREELEALTNLVFQSPEDFLRAMHRGEGRRP